MARTMYEVQVHGYGRPRIKSGPASGLLGFPEHHWVRITARPIGLKRARALADAQDCHAVVGPWMARGKVYDNGRPPRVPDGWAAAPPPAEAEL